MPNYEDAARGEERRELALDLLREAGPEGVTKQELADHLGITSAKHAKDKYVRELRESGYDIEYRRDVPKPHGAYVLADDVRESPAAGPDGKTELTQREQYIYTTLPESVDTLADDLGVSERVIEAHLETISDKGWAIKGDDAGNYIGVDQDHLRSSEHKTTRTRKANRWWQKRHDELVHRFAELTPPTATLTAESGHEDWVTHLTDLHAGDFVRQDDGTVVYSSAEIPPIIDYVTERSISLSEKHNSTYDAAHLLWGGDFLTGEGVYEGQFEDLDAWLDEQHATLMDPLIRQLKAFSEHFETVNLACIVGNHGKSRASATSRQANADLILYKSVRNVVSQLREHAGVLTNVNMLIGEAENYRNFPLRGGKLRGHLRHGQDRKPQAETSARENDWRGTLLDHDFLVAFIGHHHISGRIPWDGPPIICSGSPKPAGEFVERIGGRVPKEYQDVATALGVSDDGITSIYPIDTRDYSRASG